MQWNPPRSVPEGIPFRIFRRFSVKRFRFSVKDFSPILPQLPLMPLTNSNRETTPNKSYSPSDANAHNHNCAGRSITTLTDYFTNINANTSTNTNTNTNTSSSSQGTPQARRQQRGRKRKRQEALGDDNGNRNKKAKNTRSSKPHQGREIQDVFDPLVDKRITQHPDETFMKLKGQLYCQCCNKYVSTESSTTKRHVGMFAFCILHLHSMPMDKDIILKIIEIIHWQNGYIAFAHFLANIYNQYLLVSKQLQRQYNLL